ncbi:MAG: hypothetical protein ACRD29_25785 [Acidimicrobiales bacterium]
MEHNEHEHRAGYDQPIDLGQHQVNAAGSVSLDSQLIAQLDEAHLPDHVWGIDHNLDHAVQDEGGTAYA